MRKILVAIKGIFYRVIGMDWISGGWDCDPVLVYLVEDMGVNIIHRSVRVVEDP
jgi:hypothetical protein